jgi:hypothetical protein
MILQKHKILYQVSKNYSQEIILGSRPGPGWLHWFCPEPAPGKNKLQNLPKHRIPSMPLLKFIACDISDSVVSLYGLLG